MRRSRHHSGGGLDDRGVVGRLGQIVAHHGAVHVDFQIEIDLEGLRTAAFFGEESVHPEQAQGPDLDPVPRHRPVPAPRGGARRLPAALVPRVTA